MHSLKTNFFLYFRYGRLNIIQRILKMEQSNSVINEGDGRGLTALHIAASEGKTANKVLLHVAVT
jgi:ankyrin repeat protein